MYSFRNGIAFLFISLFVIKVALCIATINYESANSSYFESIIGQLEIENNSCDDVKKVDVVEKTYLSANVTNKWMLNMEQELCSNHAIDHHIQNTKSKFVEIISQPPDEIL